MANTAAAKKPPTKSEILANVSAATNLSKKQVAAVLEAYTAEATKSMGKKGVGVFAAISDLPVQESLPVSPTICVPPEKRLRRRHPWCPLMQSRTRSPCR